MIKINNIFHQFIIEKFSFKLFKKYVLVILLKKIVYQKCI